MTIIITVSGTIITIIAGGAVITIIIITGGAVIIITPNISDKIRATCRLRQAGWPDASTLL
jgi:hypothetical protein